MDHLVQRNASPCQRSVSVLLGVEVLNHRGDGLNVGNSLTQIFNDGLPLSDVAFKDIGRYTRCVANGFTQLGRNARFLDLGR